MFCSFDAHSRVFHGNNLNNYFMISSGTNQFSMSKLWKETLYQELQTDFLYRWYTASDGFQCITSAIKVYEDYISSPIQEYFIRSERKVCMTAGGSGAASIIFEYLHEIYGKCNIILVGMNYSLYERLAKKYNFSIFELRCKQNFFSIPQLEDFDTFYPDDKKNVFIFSLPNNPTGEIYTISQFSNIVSLIRKINGFIVLDKVCDIVISEKNISFF